MNKVIDDGKIVLDNHTKRVVVRQSDETEHKQAVQEAETPEVTLANPTFDPHKKTMLYVITHAGWAGPQKYVYDLVANFSKTHNIVVAFGMHEFTGKHIFKERLEELGVRVLPIECLGHKSVLSKDITIIWKLYQVIKETKASLVHFQDTKVTFWGGIAAKFAGVRAVATIHDMTDYTSYPAHEVTIAKFFEKITYGLVARVIALDSGIATRAQALHGSAKVQFIAPPAVREEQSPAQEKLRSIAQQAPAVMAGKLQDQATLILGNVAPLESDQGLVYLLQSLKTLKESRQDFVYIHYGDGDQKELLEMETKQFELQNHVLWKGHDSRAMSYLQCFDVVVHPTFRPGASPLMLAMCSGGRAFITSRITGIEDVLQDGTDALLVEPKDTAGLTQAIMRLAQDPSLRKTLADNIEARIVESFSHENMISATKQVYGISG